MACQYFVRFYKKYGVDNVSVRFIGLRTVRLIRSFAVLFEIMKGSLMFFILLRPMVLAVCFILFIIVYSMPVANIWIYYALTHELFNFGTWIVCFVTWFYFLAPCLKILLHWSYCLFLSSTLGKLFISASILFYCFRTLQNSSFLKHLLW